MKCGRKELLSGTFRLPQNWKTTTDAVRTRVPLQNSYARKSRRQASLPIEVCVLRLRRTGTKKPEYQNQAARGACLQELTVTAFQMSWCSLESCNHRKYRVELIDMLCTIIVAKCNMFAPRIAPMNVTHAPCHSVAEKQGLLLQRTESL